VLYSSASGAGPGLVQIRIEKCVLLVRTSLKNRQLGRFLLDVPVSAR
jgi:hypothetical protein